MLFLQLSSISNHFLKFEKNRFCFISLDPTLSIFVKIGQGWAQAWKSYSTGREGYKSCNSECTSWGLPTLTTYNFQTPQVILTYNTSFERSNQYLFGARSSSRKNEFQTHFQEVKIPLNFYINCKLLRYMTPCSDCKEKYVKFCYFYVIMLFLGGNHKIFNISYQYLCFLNIFCRDIGFH